MQSFTPAHTNIQHPTGTLKRTSDFTVSEAADRFYGAEKLEQYNYKDSGTALTVVFMVQSLLVGIVNYFALVELVTAIVIEAQACAEMKGVVDHKHDAIGIACFYVMLVLLMGLTVSELFLMWKCPNDNGESRVCHSLLPC